MTVITFEHKGGSHLLIKQIGVLLSQAAEPFEGRFAAMGLTKIDSMFTSETAFADLGSQEKAIPKLEVIDPYRRLSDRRTYEDCDGSKFLKMEIDGIFEIDEVKNALVIKNKGKPIKIKIYLYIVVPILNLRVTDNHYVKLLVTHYGVGVPHVRFKLNGKTDENVRDVPEYSENL